MSLGNKNIQSDIKAKQLSHTFRGGDISVCVETECTEGIFSCDLLFMRLGREAEQLGNNRTVEIKQTMICQPFTRPSEK